MTRRRGQISEAFAGAMKRLPTLLPSIARPSFSATGLAQVVGG